MWTNVLYKRNLEYLSIKIKMLSLNSLTLGGPETREEA